VNEQPLALTQEEIDDILADLDCALDADFLREVDQLLERTGLGESDQMDDLPVVAG